MFFRYVYGKIHQYPYLHIITWGLPRRYFGLLKIFNLQIEYQPQLFLKQYSDAFTDFEPPSTSSVSSIQSSLIEPAPSTSKYNYVNKDENEEKEEPEVEQNENAVNNSSTRKRKRSRKKPIISIKINLDDDLKNLKTRSYSKNLDRILSKRSPKTHLLVIERSTSSKRDEYHLKIVNNNIINSHPFSKLLKKNREKRKFSSSFPISVDTPKSTDVERIPSSNFTSENIYPLLNKPLKPESSYLKSPYSNDNSYQKNDESNYFTDHISDKIKNTNFQTVSNVGPIQNNVRKESLDCKNTSNNYALALPSHLIPYEEQITEEKPLRNWPIITQLFTNSNFEICKNYLKSFTANDREDTEVPEANENVQEENIKIDISPGIQYHNATKINTLINSKTFKQTELTEDENEDAQEEPEELESESRMSNVDSNYNYLINKVSSSKPKVPPKPPNYSVGQISTVHSFLILKIIFHRDCLHLLLAFK
ncbi:hypothetical protein WA026_004209 [Henosepilachna vigintioctopunctata]|uniref:Uncharacterized protein n=1 Tax=Henosepilachna vigintioctopunctata TaxID=420089 RepID=A0AAW1UEB1_9CUCU